MTACWLHVKIPSNSYRFSLICDAPSDSLVCTCMCMYFTHYLKSDGGLVSIRTHTMGSLYFSAISVLSNIEHSFKWRNLCLLYHYNHRILKRFPSPSNGTPFYLFYFIFYAKDKHFNFFYLFIKLFGWHWLLDYVHFKCTFLWYMISILYCVPTTQSQIIFCHHIFGPLYPLLPPTPFPLVSTILFSVSMSFSFTSHISVKSHMVLSFFWLILLSITVLRSIHVANGSISSFLTAE